MRLGLCLDPGRPWVALADLAQRADASGWASVYMCDHFMPAAGRWASVTDPVLEGWTALSALAAMTGRIRLGTLVLGNAYRHPAVVANMAATLDHVSAGRVVLGVGAGWQENEHVAYGIELLGVGQRLDRFAEACELIVRLLSEPPVSFAGEYYSLLDAPCEPRPVQSRLPVLVGGGGERRTMRIAARWADEWHAWATPAAFRRKVEVLEGHCSDLGRDPSTLRRLTGQVVRVVKGGAGRNADDDGSDDLVGTLDQVVDQLMRYREAGVDEFVVRDHRECSLPEAQAMVEALAERANPLIGG